MEPEDHQSPESADLVTDQAVDDWLPRIVVKLLDSVHFGLLTEVSEYFNSQVVSVFGTKFIIHVRSLFSSSTETTIITLMERA